MGDAGFRSFNLNDEDSRFSTFHGRSVKVNARLLAKAGFIYSRQRNDVKCFMCLLEIDTEVISPTICIIRYHKQMRPDCKFAMTLVVPKTSRRNKRFSSYDSLRSEQNRLETFISWPLDWLKPEDLARDGFYFLRTKDHCACVYCRGIVGVWEAGDTPRGEHQQHFPHCPFINGKPVGNISPEEGNILSKLKQITHSISVDVGGTPRHMLGSYPESSK